jgi:hypothetical protein
MAAHDCPASRAWRTVCTRLALGLGPAGDGSADEPERLESLPALHGMDDD